MSSQAVFADVLRLAHQLSPLEKIRLIEQIAPDLEAVLAPAATVPPRRRGLRGLLQGCDISPVDIEEARRVWWGDFPREDV